MYAMIEPYVVLFMSMADGYCLFLLLEEFGERRIRGKMASGMCTVCLWFTIKLLIRYVVLAAPPYSMLEQGLALGMQILGAYFISVSLYRGGQMVKLFITVVFIALRFISAQTGYGIRLFMMYVTDHLAMVIDEMNNQTLIQLLIVMFHFLEDVFMVAALYLSVKTMVKNHRHRLGGKNAKEIISYMLLPLMGSLAALISYLMIQMINEKNHMVYYDNYFEIYLFLTILFVVAWLTILYGFRLQQEIAGLTEQRIEERVLENQIVQMQDSMQEMERFYEGIRHVKHDMKNQMAVLEKLLSERQADGNGEILQYFEDMQSALLGLEQEIQTGNAVSDAVIRSKFHYAASEIEGIRLESGDFFLTEHVSVRAYDIGIILNNGLDNAITACQNMRRENPDREVYIKIKSYWKQKMFFIEIENNFEGEIAWGPDGYPRSTKPDSEWHGIGLKNIRHCALKYMGDMECIVKEDRFILSVMLKG